MLILVGAPGNSSLLKQAMDVSKDLNAVAAAIAAAMPSCRWDQINSPCSSQNYNIVLDHATDMLTRHLEDKCVGLSTPALYALVESTHYMIAVWPKEKRQDSYNSLPVLLARIFFACFDTAPDVAHAAAITLAAAAFASDYYPGDNQLSQDPSAREKRAAQVLEHYHEYRPTRHKASSLFVFGLIGLLPRLNFKTLDSQAESLPGLLTSAMKDMRLFNSKHYQTHIHTLSVDFTLQDHVRSTAYQFLLLIIHKWLSIDEELSVVFSWSSFLQHGSNWSRPNDRLYITALIALCHAKSHGL
ncbi:hypothetical protein FRC12_007071 [Ceratobasidium sp. 428]|nr:hypothetical protein FRC12_007071 [Ceratobasidium sp. 428]